MASQHLMSGSADVCVLSCLLVELTKWKQTFTAWQRI